MVIQNTEDPILVGLDITSPKIEGVYLGETMPGANVALEIFTLGTEESILYPLLAWGEIGQKPSKIVTWLADSTYLTESEDGRILFQTVVAFAAG